MCMSSCRLPTVPLPHCSTVPRPPLHLSLIMFDCCHCSRTFHGAQAHQRSKSAAPAPDPKAAALESQPEPEPDPIPDQSSKPKLSQARIWHCLSCSCCLPMSPSVPQSLLGVFSFFYSFFLASLLAASFTRSLCRRCSNYMLLKNV